MGSPRVPGGDRGSPRRARPPAAPPCVFRGWGGATIGWGSRARRGHYPGLRASAAGSRRPAQARGERRQQNSARPAVGRVYPAARQPSGSLQRRPRPRPAAGPRWTRKPGGPAAGQRRAAALALVERPRRAAATAPPVRPSLWRMRVPALHSPTQISRRGHARRRQTKHRRASREGQ